MSAADAAAEKAVLRRSVRAEMRRLPAEYLAESDARIYDNLVALPEYRAARAIFVYYSVGAEPDTRRFIETALAEGKTVTLPVCFGGGYMEPRIINSLAQLVPGEYNIPAPPESAPAFDPAELDFAVIPALAFSKDGRRLGQGGGYYDRFLSRCGFFAAGLVRERFLLDSVPFEPHDARLNCLVTDKKIARLR